MKTRGDLGVAGLAARIRAVADHQAIVDTLFRYSHSIDAGAAQEWADCFTEDGVFEAHRTKGPRSWRIKGRAQLANWLTKDKQLRTGIDRCPTVAPRITLKGNQARVVSYVVRLDEENGIPYLRNFGRYLDQMVRCPDGHWRLKKRIAEVDAQRTIWPYEKSVRSEAISGEWEMPVRGGRGRHSG